MVRTRGSQQPSPSKRTKSQGHNIPNYTLLTLVWCRQTASLFGRLSRNVTREVGNYLCEQVLLPAVYHQRLYILNICTDEHRSIPIPDYSHASFISVTSSSAACLSLQNSICGSFLVDYLTLKLTDLNLEVSVAGHNFAYIAGVCVSGVLCLFIPPEQSQTKYVLHRSSVERKEWRVSETEAITEEIVLVVEYRELVYVLLNSHHKGAYRTYNVHTDQFSPPTPLPLHPMLDHSYPSVQLPDNRLFCLMKGLNTWTWDYNSEGTYEIDNPTGWFLPLTQGVTILRGREVYWVEEYERRSLKDLVLFRYNVETKARHKEVVSIDRK